MTHPWGRLIHARANRVETKIGRGAVVKTSLRGVILTVVVLVVGAAAAGAEQRIVNGLDTQDFPTTGALLYSGGGAINGNNASSWCSGTLIGCQTFLTAAHCVEDDTAPSRYWVYLQHGGLATVSSITIHPSYDPSLSGRDIAIVELATPVTGIDPTTINSSHDLDTIGVGLDGTIAGFGQTSGSGNDYGIKRYGNVVTANCNPSTTGGEGNDKLVCWNFANPVGQPGEDSNTCNGDSGGPLFMEFAGELEVVGVTSAGSSNDCLPTDHSWDASVYYNASWITGQLGGDPTTTCGGLPPVGDTSVFVHQNNGTLGPGNTSSTFTVNLSGTPLLVRFALNGTDNAAFNPNIFVKQGLGAGPASYDCKADGTSVFGACEFSNPSPGPWSVYVQRAAGSGQFQVTTTVFGGDPPVCGNNIAEYGEECDGGDLGTCALGPCTDCSCPAPVCGNDVVEAGEECDGTSDSACPGACGSDCACPVTCSDNDLFGLKIRSDERRISYKARVFDPSSNYADFDPSIAPFTLHVTDGVGSVQIAIPAAHEGWYKIDPIRRRFIWKGDGLFGGLRRVKLIYRSTKSSGDYWNVQVKGRNVPGAGDIDVDQVLDFELGFGGACHAESW
jgi:hypothetical protein